MRWSPALQAASRCLTGDDDLRTPSSHAALAKVLQLRCSGLIVSVGGGPRRVDERLTNVNIVIAPGVDLAATAYQLPLLNGSVAGVHCEAVLEHLEFPELAVAEMLRVLRPGGLLFAATPFLQTYHAHPDHFQNFTLRGHIRLFERAGFEVLDAATCVGPSFALIDIAANFARELVPTRPLSRVAERAIRLLGRVARLADLRLEINPAAAKLASSTFVLTAKPLA